MRAVAIIAWILAAVFILPGLIMLYTGIFGYYYTDNQAGSAYGAFFIGVILAFAGAGAWSVRK